MKKVLLPRDIGILWTPFFVLVLDMPLLSTTPV
jgi:hypothetical protein